MDTGNVLLLIGLIASIVSILINKLNLRYFIYVFSLAFLSISSAVLLFVYYLISNDFDINYVYIYGGDLPVAYRIAAIWAGKEGMQLLVVWAAALCILLFYINNQKNPGFARKTLIIALGIEILFLLITLIDSPFKSASQEAGALPGNGLNPKLISFWFFVHPPLVVMAYAASIILFASATAYLYSGEREWAGTARYWGRASWLFLSLAMLTGSVWAYETVGWDGFWKWDPAQSGALVIWLILTAALHAITRHQRNFREYDTTAPLLSASVFILGIYVMFFSRKGVRGSEHNFLGSDMWAILFAAMLLITIITLYLIMRRKPQESGWKMTLKSLNSLRTSFHAAILLLCMLAFVPFWGITHAVISEKFFGDQTPIPQEIYAFWSFPLILLLTVLTGYCLAQGMMKPKFLLPVTLAAVAMGVLAALFSGTQTLLDPASEFYQQSTFIVQSIGSASIISYMPIFLFAFGGIIFRFVRGKHRFSRINIGIVLIHAGFIFIVVGAIASTSFSTKGTVDYTPLELNIPKGINAVWSTEITDVSTIKADGKSEQVLNLKFYKNGNPHGSGMVSLSKSDRFDYFHKLLVHRTLFADILVHYTEDALNPSSISLRTEVMPLVNVLWGGALLMIGGIIFLMKPNLFSKTG